MLTPQNPSPVTSIGIVIGVAYALIGILLFALSVPLLRGRVAMNRWYGVRIPKSFESDANWYALNRYGAKLLMAVAAVFIALAVLALFVPLTPGHWSFWLVLIGPVLLLLLSLLQVVRYSRAL